MPEESIESPSMAVTMAAKDALEKSAERDLFLSFAVGASVIVYAIKQLYPIFKKNGSRENRQNVCRCDPRTPEAINVLLQKDADGQYILLGIPRLVRELNGMFGKFEQSITRLVNHQEETNTYTREIIYDMHKTSKETQQAIEEMRRDS